MYEQGGRILYPACECAKKLGWQTPASQGAAAPARSFGRSKLRSESASMGRRHIECLAETSFLRQI